MDNKVAVVIAVVAVVAILGIGGAIAAASGMFNPKDDSAEYITYYGNGGKDVQGNDSERTKILEAMANPFTKEGNTFWGWNTKADGTGDKVDVGDTLTLGTKLYAQWSDKTLTIKNIVYMFSGLSMYITDDVRTNEKITTFGVPLSNSGTATISYKNWDDVTFTSSSPDKVTFSGHVTRSYQYSVTLELYISGATCVFSVGDDGHTANVQITYTGNVEFD